MSPEGLFQLTDYGWLIFRNYPAIKRVKLREFYVRRTQARLAEISRDDLKWIEPGLSNLTRDLDLAMVTGKPEALRFPEVAPWVPTPGQHCTNCIAPHLCPIPEDARERYAITSPKRAARAVKELSVAKAIVKWRTAALRPYIERYGPIPVPGSREVFGLKTQKGGRQVLTYFEPNGDDGVIQRSPEDDESLEEALRRSVEAIEAEKNVDDALRRVEAEGSTGAQT